MPSRAPSQSRSSLSTARRPNPDEVEFFARLISEREGRSLEESREQAELQLWACRPELPSRRSRQPLDTLAVA